MTTFSVLVVAGVVLGAGDPPAMPAPVKEHGWLKKFEGEWEFTGTATMGPGQPPIQTKGTESVKSLGGFFIVGDMKAECMGMPMTGLTTVGYDPAKKKYVGTWVCSMADWLCQYEGEVDAAGKVLTLNCEGPSPLDPTGKTKAKMRDVTEFKDDGTRVLTSTVQGPDGKWTEFMRMTFKRKK